MSEKLKPCPFCGGEEWRGMDYDSKNNKFYVYGCSNRDCYIYGVWFSLEGWNTRPLEDKTRREALEKCTARVQDWADEAWENHDQQLYAFARTIKKSLEMMDVTKSPQNINSKENNMPKGFDPNYRFVLDGDAGYVYDMENGEWLTTAEEVYNAVYEYIKDVTIRSRKEVITAYENPTKSKEIG